MLKIYWLFCWQQYDVIRVHTDFEVEEYYGAKGVDEWDSQCWQKEINKNDVSLLCLIPRIIIICIVQHQDMYSFVMILYRAPSISDVPK